MFKDSSYTIHQKITSLLIIYFLVAFAAIASTLYVTWQLEGGAAAINDAGSQRMRSYQIGFLVSQFINRPSEHFKQEISLAMEHFEKTLDALDYGVPARPLSLPDDPQIRLLLSDIKTEWYQNKKRRIKEMLAETDNQKSRKLLENYSDEIHSYVSKVNKLVGMIEHSQSQATTLLRTFQIGLVSLAFLGTVILLYIFMHIVIQPVRNLQQGLSQMSTGDFSVRLPVKSSDEFGDLTTGFNHMAEELQHFYLTLEQRVKDKTQNIEMKSKELRALYDTASYLNQSTMAETIYDGVLGKMVTLFDATAGVIRLLDTKKSKMSIVAWYGVSEVFLKAESEIKCGDCICGATAESDDDAHSTCFSDFDKSVLSFEHCKHENFGGIVSVPIKARNKVLGVINLFFRDVRVLPLTEVKLLETVGQQLGVAIENQRLVDREKEMAIFEERNLLAQELHDSIAQSLAFLNIQVQLLQDGISKGKAKVVDEILRQIKAGIQESYDDVRELLVHFRTRIEHDDIDMAIQTTLEKFEEQTEINTTYKYEGHSLALQPEIVLQVLHILHECLANIRKHSQATLVEVHLFLGTESYLMVSDNGVGFDNNTLCGETHVGLQIMKERANRIHGHVKIESVEGKGTKITMLLPQQHTLVTGTA